MATEKPIQRDARTAAADLSAKQHLFVKLVAAGKINLCGDGEFGYGVLKDQPKSGQAGTVDTHGITKVIAGGVVAVNDLGASDAAGKAVVAATGDFILCRFLEAGVAGQVVSVELLKSGAKAP
jgi:hypothetical protein